MNENQYPDVNEMETEASVIGENTDDTENTVLTDASDEEESSNDIWSSSSRKVGVYDDADTYEEEDEVETSAKKKFPLQVPVIIAACIVLAAVLAYVVYMGFFLKEPEGVLWKNETESATYYYEFNSDGTLMTYIGSIEISGMYSKSKTDGENTISVNSGLGDFYSSSPATYTITGSRILGNQTMTCSYGESYQFTLNQASGRETLLEPSEDFVPDEELVGSWVVKFMGYEMYKTTFNKDGTMSVEDIQNGVRYTGIYTIGDAVEAGGAATPDSAGATPDSTLTTATNGSINFTYCVTENIVVPLDYSLTDHDHLNFMGYVFVREGSAAAEATDDQAMYSVAG